MTVSARTMKPFVIIGSRRSGTTYLRRSLHNHPDIVCHGEPFGPESRGALEAPVRMRKMPSKEERDADPIAYLDRMLAFHTSGLVGFKLLLAHSPPVLNEIAARGYRLIILRRENALAKYSSDQILMAMQGSGDPFNLPANDGPSAIKAIFDTDAFERYMEGERGRWKMFGEILEQHSPPRFNLEYSELAWGDGRERALGFLGAELRPLEAGIQKHNSTNVLSRFANPDVVEGYLSAKGLEDWAQEGPPGKI